MLSILWACLQRHYRSWPEYCHRPNLTILKSNFSHMELASEMGETDKCFLGAESQFSWVRDTYSFWEGLISIIDVDYLAYLNQESWASVIECWSYLFAYKSSDLITQLWRLIAIICSIPKRRQNPAPKPTPANKITLIWNQQITMQIFIIFTMTNNKMIYDLRRFENACCCSDNC